LSVHHTSKSGADWLEKRKAQIVDALPPERFPQILSLEDQGLFAVGYYQQREHFFVKRGTAVPSTTETKETNP
jgi:CRISPR-associated protein Csd1